MENLALLFTAISAISAAAAAVFMFFQNKMAIEERRRSDAERNDLQQRENDLLAVNNKILINQMWNHLNRIIIEGDEGVRGIIGSKNYDGLDPALVRRIYLTFCTINVIEVAWRMMGVGAIPEAQALAILDDQAAILKNDTEAARHALSGRGYSSDFLEVLWPRVFPDEPVPRPDAA